MNVTNIFFVVTASLVSASLSTQTVPRNESLVSHKRAEYHESVINYLFFVNLVII